MDRQAAVDLAERVGQLEVQLADLSARPAVVSMNTIVHNNNSVTNSQIQQLSQAGQAQEQVQAQVVQQLNQVMAPGAVGWPAKWGAPPPGAAPFYPNSLPMLTGDHLAAADREKRRVGSEDEKAASFVVSLLRAVREDPQCRNVFVSPSRADQALVKLAEHWEHIPLDQAKRELLGHVAERLTHSEDPSAPSISGIVGAGRREFAQEVGKCLSALLLWRPEKSVAGLSGSDKIAAAVERGAVQRMVADGPSDEMSISHLVTADVVINLETACGVWSAEDAQGMDPAELAASVVLGMVIHVQRGYNKNLHMVLVTADRALRYSYTEGWVERAATDLAAHLSCRLAKIAARHIEKNVASPLAPAAAFLREKLGAYDGEQTEPGPWFYEPWAMRVLARFSRVAVQRCTLETPGYRALRRILARELGVDPEDEASLAMAHRTALEEAVLAPREAAPAVTAPPAPRP